MTYPAKFLEFFDRLIGHEGGFTKDPRDNGNWTGGRVNVGELKGTKFGIAANTYGHLDIENLTLDDARAIYYMDWWVKPGLEHLHPAFAFQVWQFAINAGIGTAKRGVQFAVRVAQDGHIGPVTVAAIQTMDLNDGLMRFNAFVLRHYTSLSSWPTWGKGWANRVAGNLVYAADDN